MQQPAPLVKCPQCGAASLFAPSNHFRPFCSERCKKIDFGGWASESFRVTGAQTEPLDDVPAPHSSSSTTVH